MKPEPFAELQNNLANIAKNHPEQFRKIKKKIAALGLTVESRPMTTITLKKSGRFTTVKTTSPISMMLNGYYVGSRDKVVLTFTSLSDADGSHLEIMMKDICTKISDRDIGAFCDRLEDMVGDVIEECDSDLSYAVDVVDSNFVQNQEELRMMKRMKNPKYGSW